MTLTLDPAIPLVWRNPRDLQFGVDYPHLVIRDLSPADEQVIAALTAGVTAEGAVMLAQRAGGTRLQVEELLALLEPVLGCGSLARTGLTIALAGMGDAATAVRSGLDAAGHTVVPTEAAAQLGIVVASYTAHPQVFSRWLRSDVPHIPVTLGDAVITVGPVVVPGAGPCLNCVFYHRTAEDEAWPALAIQLMDRVSPLRAPESAATILRAAAHAVYWADMIAAGCASALAGLRWQLCERSREITETRVEPHPMCGCATLPENGSADVRSPGRTLNGSTTAPAAAALG